VSLEQRALSNPCLLAHSSLLTARSSFGHAATILALARSLDFARDFGSRLKRRESASTSGRSEMRVRTIRANNSGNSLMEC